MNLPYMPSPLCTNIFSRACLWDCFAWFGISARQHCLDTHMAFYVPDVQTVVTCIHTRLHGLWSALCMRGWPPYGTGMNTSTHKTYIHANTHTHSCRAPAVAHARRPSRTRGTSRNRTSMAASSRRRRLPFLSSQTSTYVGTPSGATYFKMLETAPRGSTATTPTSRRLCRAAWGSSSSFSSRRAISWRHILRIVSSSFSSGAWSWCSPSFWRPVSLWCTTHRPISGKRSACMVKSKSCCRTSSWSSSQCAWTSAPPTGSSCSCGRSRGCWSTPPSGYVPTSMYVCMCVCVYVCVPTYMLPRTLLVNPSPPLPYWYMYAVVFVNICVHVYMHVFVCIYTYIDNHACI